jgi:hypothetical protein
VGIQHSNSALCTFAPPLIVVADADAEVNGNGERLLASDTGVLERRKFMNSTLIRPVGGLDNPMTPADPKPPAKRKVIDDSNPLAQAAKKAKKQVYYCFYMLCFFTNPLQLNGASKRKCEWGVPRQVAFKMLKLRV